MALMTDAPEMDQTHAEATLVDSLPYTQDVDQPQYRHVSFYTRLRTVVTSFLSMVFSPKPTCTAYHYHQPTGSAVDQLARHHPYMYIKAMSG
jgi:hypothetical protein